VGDLERADRLCNVGRGLAEGGAGDDAKEHPEAEVALEEADRGRGRFLADDFTLGGHGGSSGGGNGG